MVNSQYNVGHAFAKGGTGGLDAGGINPAHPVVHDYALAAKYYRMVG
jgi:hypothetical protein